MFIDDIHVYLKDRKDHDTHLRVVLETLRKERLYGKKIDQVQVLVKGSVLPLTHCIRIRDSSGSKENKSGSSLETTAKCHRST